MVTTWETYWKEYYFKRSLFGMTTGLGALHRLPGRQQPQPSVAPLLGDVDAWGPFESPTAADHGFSLQRH